MFVCLKLKGNTLLCKYKLYIYIILVLVLVKTTVYETTVLIITKAFPLNNTDEYDYTELTTLL